MSGFETFAAPAFVLAEADIDTDIIFPARFLLHTEKTGLGRFAFHDRAPLREAYLTADAPPILLAGANFGCGSSREHAVWALAGLGIRAIFAPSFGEIFRGNCANNGIVAGLITDESIARLARGAGDLTVDLAARTVSAAGDAIPFEIADSDREMLLAGWNSTTRIVALHGDDIAHFETAQRETALWLWTKDPIA